MNKKDQIRIFTFQEDYEGNYISFQEKEGIGHLPFDCAKRDIINKYGTPNAFEYEGVKYVNLFDRNRYVTIDEFKRLLKELEEL